MTKRIDGWLASLGYCTRSQSHHFLRTHKVYSDNQHITNPATKVSHSSVTIDGEKLDPISLIILMNKPKGFICSHNDNGPLIYSLLPNRWQQRNPKIATIGRLDADTTGALLLSDDGTLNHKLSSPKKLVTKLYRATLKIPFDKKQQTILESGTLLLRGEKKPLLPARITICSSNCIEIEIHEGRYHQIKRMLAAVGNQVIELHRLRFGSFDINNLEIGEYIVLNT